MKITSVEILSPNLIETEKFYSERLGLLAIEKSNSILSYQIGSSKLTFKKCEIKNPVYHFAFNIAKNQLIEVEHWLISILTPLKYNDKNIVDFKNWNAKSIYFLDNSGNVLELIARYDLNNESDAEFDFSKTTISEIAFVTDDVDYLANRIINDYGLTYFAKQPTSKDFSVLGDDNGLIILSRRQRHWFPTQVEAGKFWIKIAIENNGKQSTIELDNDNYQDRKLGLKSES